jgi:hypothetical protein
VARRAFIDRTRPNVLGVHFYDEPGLTWAKDLETGEMSPHVVPWQQRSYEAAFGHPPLDWKIKPNWYLPTWYGNTTADEFRLEQ